MGPKYVNYLSILAAMLLVGTALPFLTPVAALSQPVPPPGAGAEATAVPLPQEALVVKVQPAVDKAAYPGLESRLAQLYQAYQAGDQESLATFAGQRHIDLAAGTVRVILEMEVDPQAQALGGPTVETVTLPDGRTAQVQHAPRIAIRPDLEAAIAAAGATYETAYKDWVQVLAPISSLEALTRIPGVRSVRLPLPAQQHGGPPPGKPAPQAGPDVGTRTTQGVNLTNAATWHAAGYDGTGVHLAVFDFGFTGWAARQSDGDLPSGSNLVLHNFSSGYNFNPDTSGYEHGTACAEIAYDMAPGATVHLYAWGTEAEFGNAVSDYINNVSGKKVATMSIGWVNAGPYDGTGPINNIVDGARAAGIFWANSAGNFQKEHWSGVATQYGTGNSVAFGSGNVEGIGPSLGFLWDIGSGTTLRIFLEWNDWNASRTGNQNHIDYDLYLYRWTGSGWTQVAYSEGDQCSTSLEPTEAIAYTVPPGGPYRYGLLIQRYTGGGACPNNFGHWLELYTFNGFYQSGQGSVNSFWYINGCNSLTIPADGDSAVAVGATFWNEDEAAPLYGLETFTSLGPRNAAGGGNPTGTVNKPDVVAPDGVDTATYSTNDGTNYANGGGGFWGTSGASPHVAGLAATVWEAYPGYTLAQLRDFVQNYALYKGHGGACGVGQGGGTACSAPDAAPQEAGIESLVQNNVFGWGRIHLPPDPSSPPSGGKASQCLDNAAGLLGESTAPPPKPAVARPDGALPPGSPPPHARVTTHLVQARDEGSLAEPAGEAGPAGEEPVAAPAQAQPEAVATIPNLQVDGGYALPYASAHIDTAVDSQGNIYVAYEYLDGSDYDLVVGKSVDNGRTWTLYLVGDADQERHPALAIDAADYLWIAFDRTSGGTIYPSYLKSSNPADISDWTETTFTGYTNVANPAVATYGSGGTGIVYMAWQWMNGSYYDTRYWFTTNGGSNWTTGNFGVLSYDQLYPALALANSGGITYVSCARQYNTGGGGDINVQYRTASGGQWSLALSRATIRAETYPALAASGSYVYLAWQYTDNTGDDEIYSRYSTNGGQSYNASDIAIAATNANERYPSLAASGANVRAVYAYDDGASVQLKQSTNNGQTWGAAYTMTDLDNKVREGFRCLDVSYRLAAHPVVAWIDLRNNGLNPDPYYATLDDPPTAPSLSWPGSGATLYTYAPVLSWSASSDPDGDTVRYWWYVDTATPPANRVGGPIAATSALPFYTAPGKTYSWKVVADDGYRTVSSAVRSFTTAVEDLSGSPPAYVEDFDGGDPVTEWTKKAFACLDCFEAAPIRWAVSPSDKWERSATYAWNGSYSAHSLYDANNADYQLTSPALDLRGATWAYFNTHFRGSSEAGYDWLSLDKRPDGSSAWTTLDLHSGNYNNTWYTYYEGNVDLSAYAGTNTAQVRLRFTTDSSNYGGSYGVGWYEDDVEVARTSEWAWRNESPYYYRLQTQGSFVGYTDNLVDQFYSPYIQLPNTSGQLLWVNLVERYSIAAGDRATIWVRDTAAGTWEQLITYNGTQSTWTSRYVQIPDSYKGKTVVVALILRSDDTGTLGGPEESGGYWDVDYFRLLEHPTAVKLIRFEAWPSGPAVQIEWETASEVGNAGFNLYRSLTPEERGEQLNEALIPSRSLGLEGAVYSWEDRAVQPGVACYYWLEAVDMEGVSTLYGPVGVTVAPSRHLIYLPAVSK